MSISLSLRASPQTGVAIRSQNTWFLRFSMDLQLKDYGFPRRFAPRSKYPWGAPRNDRTSLSTRWGYFLSRKKVPKERFKGRGISISPERALRVRLTIFAKQKSVFWLNAKETPDGFLSHDLPFRKQKAVVIYSVLNSQTKKISSPLRLLVFHYIPMLFGIFAVCILVLLLSKNGCILFAKTQKC